MDHHVSKFVEHAVKKMSGTGQHRDGSSILGGKGEYRV
jgi:hypothetical protein